MTCGKSSYKEKVFLSQRIKADSVKRQVETEIMDSVMGPAVYDSRIRPSGINGTGEKADTMTAWSQQTSRYDLFLLQMRPHLFMSTSHIYPICTHVH